MDMILCVCVCVAHCTFKTFWPAVNWARLKRNQTIGQKLGLSYAILSSFVLLFLYFGGVGGGENSVS